MHFANSILDLIGNTPVVRLPGSATGIQATVLCKLEFLNPCGSVKDRMAKHIICTEEKRGTIKPGDTICDNTSGNTGTAVAMVAAAKGYKSIFACPDKTSQEKIDLIRSFGGKVIVTPSDVPSHDPRSCYMVSKTLAEEKGYYWLNQYDNPLNPEAHYLTTGPEIWSQTDGRITHLVAGAGTGGTISGAGRFLKEKNRSVRVIGVEPCGSLFQAITAGNPLPEAKGYKVEGIGTDMLVKAYQPQYVDQVIQVADDDAFLEARYLSRKLGISVGGSTGAIFHAVREVGKDLDGESVVVFLACDGGIRYVTKFYSDSWMRDYGFPLEKEPSDSINETSPISN